MSHPSAFHLPGVHPSPNIQQAPDIYELENRAADPQGLLEHAMRAIVPWDGKIVLDLGAGTGFHIPRFSSTAAHVFAVEPHDESRLLALQRAARLQLRNASILTGSAEQIPLRDHSIDVCHSRFAYFFAPDCLPGLREIERVIRPGGTSFIIDNDLEHGTFARWLRHVPFYKDQDAAQIESFWREQGFTEQSIESEWRFERREDLERVVQLEFGNQLAQQLLAEHEGLQVSYHYKLYYRSY